MCSQIVLSNFTNLTPCSRSVIFPRVGLGLHSMLTAAGYEIRQNRGYNWHGLSRGKEPFVIFQYTLSGRGTLEYEGHRQEILPGMAMLLFFPHNNRYWLPTGGRWEFFYLCLNGSEILRIWKNVIQRHGPLLKLPIKSPALKMAADTCLQILNSEVNSPWMASSIAYTLAMTLFENINKNFTVSENLDRPAPIKDAIAYCRENLSSPISVEEIATAVGYSRFHFTRLFFKSEGLSPSEYISHIRMQKAAELLKFTKEPIKQIAYKCGFQSSCHFGKVFHKTYGLSPSNFRNSGMF